MAITSLRLTNPFPSPRLLPSNRPQAPKPFTVRATDTQPSEGTKPEPESPRPGSDSESDQFEARLSQVRVRYRSGTGKKAEMRKSKKGGSTGSTRSGSGIYLPPVPLKEPVSGGLKVDFGFSPYSERVNGRIALLGLTALLLVELATGKSVMNYHTPSIVLIVKGL